MTDESMNRAERETRGLPDPPRASTLRRAARRDGGGEHLRGTEFVRQCSTRHVRWFCSVECLIASYDHHLAELWRRADPGLRTRPARR